MVTDDSRVRVQASYAVPHKNGAALWEEERFFMAASSREETELAELMQAMQLQLAPALPRVVQLAAASAE